MENLKQDIFNNLNEIGNLDNIIPLEISENLLKYGKLILFSTDSHRRVEEKSEVKFFFKRYICLKENQSLRISNKDYKNIYKKSIENMIAAENILRKCLLELYDKQVVIFKVHKDFDRLQYERTKTELKIEDMTLYEDYMYYHISAESITYPQPNEPKSLHVYDKFIKKYQDEIRYLISIESYTNAIGWSNTIIQKFFNMSKELKKQMTENLKKNLTPQMKVIYLNKTLALFKKPSKESNKDYEEIIKIVKEYYSLFPEIDEKYIKISKRLVKCYLQLKDYENAEIKIKELSTIKQDEEVNQLLEELNMYKNILQKKKKPNLLKALSNQTGELNQDFSWTEALTEMDLRHNLEISVLNILN